MILGTKSRLTGDWGDFGPASNEWKETTPEQIREDLERMRDKLKQEQPPDVALIDPEWFAKLMFHGMIYEEENDFWYDFCGLKLRVVVSAMAPVGKMLLCRWKDVCVYLEEEKPADCSGKVTEKTEPKHVCCRVCGTRYQSKAEAKQCQRSHEWQNRRGRR